MAFTPRQIKFYREKNSFARDCGSCINNQERRQVRWNFIALIAGLLNGIALGVLGALFIIYQFFGGI